MAVRRRRFRRRRRGYRKSMRKRFDLQPQFMCMQAVRMATNTANVVKLPVPIPRIMNAKYPIVLEIMKVEYMHAFNQDKTRSSIGIATCNLAGVRAVDWMGQTGCIHCTYFETGDPMYKSFQLDTNDGRGPLVASDTIRFHFANDLVHKTTPNANSDYETKLNEWSVNVKIWYRFIMVGISEYLGIVNQQNLGGIGQ